MMQPSELDRKVLPLSPSHAKKQHRASDPTAQNYLSAVPQPVPSHKHSSESLPDISTNEKSWLSENPQTDVPNETQKYSPET